jgi:hypothetical protein
MERYGALLIPEVRSERPALRTSTSSMQASRGARRTGDWSLLVLALECPGGEGLIRPVSPFVPGPAATGADRCIPIVFLPIILYETHCIIHPVVYSHGVVHEQVPPSTT